MQVLIVEDEIKLAEVLSLYLTRENLDVHCIGNGLQVMPWLEQHDPALILLDLNLPGKDGLALCRDIRQHSQVPIIMTTARVDEIDRLLGLELGADDYVCKPYSPREVVARVKAVLRRSSADSVQVRQALTGVLSFDDEKLQAVLQGQFLSLTVVEYQLLKLLASTPGRIYSRDQLMDGIYSDNRVVSDRTIDSHVKKLRKKMSDAAPDLELLHSVYGAGYKVELPV